MKTRFMSFSLLIVSMVLTSFLAEAGTFYRCVDRDGNEILTTNPIDEITCKPVSEFQEMTDQEKLDYEKVREEKEIRREEEYVKAKEKEETKAAEEARDARLREIEENTKLDEVAYPVYPQYPGYPGYPAHPRRKGNIKPDRFPRHGSTQYKTRPSQDGGRLRQHESQQQAAGKSGERTLESERNRRRH
ncbi:MAG: hypothetical protein ACYDGO_00260 [Smithellaceae bacterium]